ncbi:hypothetical protein BJ170DRAFT_612223, partial [Xylariales sp. AK1849]
MCSGMCGDIAVYSYHMFEPNCSDGHRIYDDAVMMRWLALTVLTCPTSLACLHMRPVMCQSLRLTMTNSRELQDPNPKHRWDATLAVYLPIKFKRKNKFHRTTLIYCDTFAKRLAQRLSRRVAVWVQSEQLLHTCSTCISLGTDIGIIILHHSNMRPDIRGHSSQDIKSTWHPHLQVTGMWKSRLSFQVIYEKRARSRCLGRLTSPSTISQYEVHAVLHLVSESQEPSGKYAQSRLAVNPCTIRLPA